MTTVDGSQLRVGLFLLIAAVSEPDRSTGA